MTKKHFYEFDTPASQSQEGDEFDACVTWVMSETPALDKLEKLAEWTGCEVRQIDIGEADGGVDYLYPSQQVQLLAWLASDVAQGREKHIIRQDKDSGLFRLMAYRPASHGGSGAYADIGHGYEHHYQAVEAAKGLSLSAFDDAPDAPDKVSVFLGMSGGVMMSARASYPCHIEVMDHDDGDDLDDAERDAREREFHRQVAAHPFTVL